MNSLSSFLKSLFESVLLLKTEFWKFRTTCRTLQNNRISALADAIIQPMMYFDPVWHSKQLLLQKLFLEISFNFTHISHSMCNFSVLLASTIVVILMNCGTLWSTERMIPKSFHSLKSNQFYDDWKLHFFPYEIGQWLDQNSHWTIGKSKTLCSSPKAISSIQKTVTHFFR